MTSPEQIKANRANAQHSTGPRTPEGKEASSSNARKHALTGVHCILDSEDPAQFQALVTDLRFEHRPVTPTEEILVFDMAALWWKVLRAQRFQSELLNENPEDVTTLMRYERYEQANRRAFHRTLDQIKKLQKDPSRKPVKMTDPGAALRNLLAAVDPSLALHQSNPLFAASSSGSALRADLANYIEAHLAGQQPQPAQAKPENTETAA